MTQYSGYSAYNLFELKKGLFGKGDIRCKKCGCLYELKKVSDSDSITLGIKKAKTFNSHCPCHLPRNFFNNHYEVISGTATSIPNEQCVKLLNASTPKAFEELQDIVNNYNVQKKHFGITETTSHTAVNLSSECGILDDKGSCYSLQKVANKLVFFPFIPEIERHIQDVTNPVSIFQWKNFYELVRTLEVDVIELDLARIDNICSYTIGNKLKKIIFTVDGQTGYYVVGDSYYTVQNSYRELVPGLEKLLIQMLPDKFDNTISELVKGLEDGKPHRFTEVLQFIQIHLNNQKQMSFLETSSEDNVDLINQIEALAELKNLGLLTDEEFALKKGKLLEAIQ